MQERGMLVVNVYCSPDFLILMAGRYRLIRFRFQQGWSTILVTTIDDLKVDINRECRPSRVESGLVQNQ
jgi:hypothetical protein